jgi:hypothetical protein
LPRTPEGADERPRHAPGEVRVVADDAERGVELVGHAGGELDQGRHLLRLDEAQAGPLQLVLHLEALELRGGARREHPQGGIIPGLLHHGPVVQGHDVTENLVRATDEGDTEVALGRDPEHVLVVRVMLIDLGVDLDDFPLQDPLARGAGQGILQVLFEPIIDPDRQGPGRGSAVE